MFNLCQCVNDCSFSVKAVFSNKKNNKKIDCLVQVNGTGLHGLHHGLHDGLKTEHFSVVEGKNSKIMNRI